MPSKTRVAHEARTYCRICEAACGLRVELDAQQRPLRILPDKDHPVSRGYVCAKGTRFLDVANHADRLRFPQTRTADGSLTRISWDAAVEQAASRLRPIIDSYGPHAVGVYYGNPLLFNALGLVGVLAFTRALGTRNIFSSFSQDCNNKFKAAELIHGGPLVQPIPDLKRADFALMLGTNPAVSQGSFVHLEGGASAFDRYVARGGEVVWVDPRRSESARRWGEHLPIRPGADVYLLLALLNALRDLYEPGEHEAGLAQLLSVAADYPVARTANLTAIPANEITRLAERIRTADACTFHLSVGVNMGPFGTLAAVALQALAYLTGNFDRAGGLLFHPMGHTLSGLLARLGIGTEPAPSRVGGFTGVFDELPGGILADEILTPGREQIRALIVIAGNPLTSIPGEARLREAFESLDTLIQIDLFENETGQIGLPTLGVRLKDRFPGEAVYKRLGFSRLRDMLVSFSGFVLAKDGDRDILCRGGETNYLQEQVEEYILSLLTDAGGGGRSPLSAASWADLGRPQGREDVAPSSREPAIASRNTP